MNDLEILLENFPVQSMKAGSIFLHQDEKVDCIYILKSGKVKIIKDDIDVAVSSVAGAVFGEMSIFMEIPHSASVVCLENSTFHVIENPAENLAAHPELLWHIARILSVRLFNLNQYLVDLKVQFEGHDHLGMVDEVLETLMNQQQTEIYHRQDSQRDTPDY